MPLARLSIVNVSLEIPPGSIVSGVNALVKPGASASTLSVAETGVLAPSDEVTVSGPLL